MKLPFTRKPKHLLSGHPALTADPARVGLNLTKTIGNLSHDEKVRLVAGMQTDGELELRIRFPKDQDPLTSIWIMAADGQGIELVSPR